MMLAVVGGVFKTQLPVLWVMLLAGGGDFTGALSARRQFDERITHDDRFKSHSPPRSLPAQIAQ